MRLLRNEGDAKLKLYSGRLQNKRRTWLPFLMMWMLTRVAETGWTVGTQGQRQSKCSQAEVILQELMHNPEGTRRFTAGSGTSSSPEGCRDFQSPTSDQLLLAWRTPLYCWVPCLSTALWWISSIFSLKEGAQIRQRAFKATESGFI